MASSRLFTFPCFKNKVVVITGASSGIGKATAIEFAKDGAKLAITGRNAERLSLVAEKSIQQGIPSEKVLQMIGDIADEVFLKRFISKTVDQLGGVDVLVNNAGYEEGRMPSQFDKSKLDGMMNVMLKPIYTTVECCLPHLKKSKGNIVNISSITATVTQPITMEYCLTKSAVSHLGRNLAYEMAKEGIRINTIEPGVIETPMIEADGKYRECAVNMSGFKRIGHPNEVASVIKFLASPAASYVTGAKLVVDGGQSTFPFFQLDEM